MNQLTFLIFFVVVGYLRLISTASTGAKQSSCPSMFPAHAGLKQVEPPPYEIVPTSSSYGCTSSPITVSIVSANGTGFRGFLCQPRTDVGDYKTYGSIVLDDHVTNNCGNETAITHTEPSLKTAISFVWTPPSHDVGTVYIVCTIVKNWTIFWHQLSSVGIRYTDQCSKPTSSSVTPTSTSTKLVTVTNKTASSSTLSTGSSNLTLSTITSRDTTVNRNVSVNQTTVNTSPSVTSASVSVDTSTGTSGQPNTTNGTVTISTSTKHVTMFPTTSFSLTTNSSFTPYITTESLTSGSESSLVWSISVISVYIMAPLLAVSCLPFPP